MLITLTTDFGYRDSFAGIMKGVIKRIDQDAQLIDLTHGIPPQDIMAAALTLRHSVPYFSDGTIHVVVVDPGVGGSRRPLLIECAGNYFIGPDNGVLSLAVGNKQKLVIELTNSEYFLQPAGSTFHGRDIFAPAAAHLSLGVPIDAFGAQSSSFIELHVPEAVRDQSAIMGEIIYIDGYGNLFTNVYAEDLASLPHSQINIAVGSTRIQNLMASYDSVAQDQLTAVVNSWGVLEIAEYKGNAQQRCGAKVGDKVIVTALLKSPGGF
jgi:S-adenosyl-L-methionine hydrolase (adenosine-forming)